MRFLKFHDRRTLDIYMSPSKSLLEAAIDSSLRLFCEQHLPNAIQVCLKSVFVGEQWVSDI